MDIDRLIEEKILKKMEFEELGEHEVLNAIHDDFLNPSGIRRRCLKFEQGGSRRGTHIGKKL
jgi:hypothetical protein